MNQSTAASGELLVTRYFNSSYSTCTTASIPYNITFDQVSSGDIFRFTFDPRIYDLHNTIPIWSVQDVSLEPTEPINLSHNSVELSTSLSIASGNSATVSVGMPLSARRTYPIDSLDDAYQARISHLSAAGDLISETLANTSSEDLVGVWAAEITASWITQPVETDPNDLFRVPDLITVHSIGPGDMPEGLELVLRLGAAVQITAIQIAQGDTSSTLGLSSLVFSSQDGIGEHLITLPFLAAGAELDINISYTRTKMSGHESAISVVQLRAPTDVTLMRDTGLLQVVDITPAGTPITTEEP